MYSSLKPSLAPLLKLLKRYIARKEGSYALVVDFLADLPADMRHFPNFERVMGTSTLKMGSEVCVISYIPQKQESFSIAISESPDFRGRPWEYMIHHTPHAHTYNRA